MDSANSIFMYGFGLFFSSVLFLFMFVIATKDEQSDPLKRLGLAFSLLLVFFASSYLLHEVLMQPAFHVIKGDVDYGFSFLQGALVAFVFVYWRHRSNLGTWLSVLDSLMVALLPALLFYEFFAFLGDGRLGKMTNLPIGVEAYSSPIGGEVVAHKRHPLHLYGLVGLVGVVLLLFRLNRFELKKGVLFYVLSAPTLFLYFMLDFLRDDVNRLAGSSITLNQLLLIAMLVLVVGGLPVLLYRAANRESPLASFARLFEWLPSSSAQRTNLFVGRFMLTFCLLGFVALVPHQYWQRGLFEDNGNSFLVKDLQEKIVVNIPSKTLYYRNLSYPVSVGNVKLQTPIGVGRVVSKRKLIHFVYTEGPKKGSVIWYAKDLKGRRFEVPYDRMRGLGLKINGLTDYVIHSTTEDWNISRSVSSGCIRMTIPNMLEFYPLIKRNTPIVIDYILGEVKNNHSLVVYEDVYGLGHCIVSGVVVGLKPYLVQEITEKTGKTVHVSKLEAFLRYPVKGKKTISISEVAL